MDAANQGSPPTRPVDPRHAWIGSDRYPSHFRERVAECGHFLFGAHGHAHALRPDRPAAADHHAVVGHRLGKGRTVALHIHHEAVRFGRQAVKATLAQPGDGGLPDLGVLQTSLRDQLRVAQAGQCRCKGGHRQRVLAQARQLAQALRMRCSHAKTQAGHAVQLGEGAQHDQVIALGHLCNQAGLFAVLQIGLVQQHPGTCGLVGQQPGQLVGRTDRAGGVVGIAHVQQAGRSRVRGGRHRAQVVRAIAAQRYLLHMGAARSCHLAQRLEGRVGHHQARLRAGPQCRRTVQRFAGARIQAHVVGGNAGLGDECVAHLTGQGEAVTAAAGDAVARRLLGSGRGAIRAFVEVQQHRARIGGWRRNGRRLGLGRPGQAQLARARPAPASCRKWRREAGKVTGDGSGRATDAR